MKAFRVLGRAIKATYEELFLAVGVSLLWWAGVVLLVTAAPATMGLHAVANRVANYRRSGTEFFWSEAKRNVGRSWLLLGGLFLVAILIPFNIWFYSGATGWLTIVSVLWGWVLLLFLMVAQYLFPLLNQQTEPDLRMALRNAVLLALRSPLYSALSVIFQIALVVLSFALVVPVLLLMPAMLAFMQNFALTGLLQEMGLAEPPPTLPKE